MGNEKEDKLKALKLTLDKLDKTYGKGTVMKMGDSPDENVEAIPSGSIGLDLALGVGGYPKGRVVEIYGPESSGKTTLTLHAIAECQKKGGIAAFIDAEHAFDRFYAEKLGVDISTMTRNIQRIDKQGLIERKPNENDKRSIKLFLSSRGQKLTLLLNDDIANQLSSILDKYDFEQIEKIQESLESVGWNLYLNRKDL